MTQIELAFAEIQKLPPADQNKFAAWILEELHSEERWAKLFAKSRTCSRASRTKHWQNIKCQTNQEKV